MTISTEIQRNLMVSQQVRTWDVLDPAVLKVMSDIPREHFIAGDYRSLAYAEANIPLAADTRRLTLRPQIEGRLLQTLDISRHDSVLEIGTGSGFVTACLCHLARQVTSLDTDPQFIRHAGQKLAELGITNCDLRLGDLSGLDENLQFDAIAVLGSVPVFDRRFQERLKPGGRLFLVVGQAPLMEALLVRRTGAEEWTRLSLFETVIPPLENVAKHSAFTF
jgi:protein-L-isoaspartate(D-aspartate) O-methyltransferase